MSNIISIDINNGQTMQLEQSKEKDAIILKTVCNNETESAVAISHGDFVMLMNYYRYIKDNDIHCDFINPDA